jgi:hypothetical protein
MRSAIGRTVGAAALLIAAASSPAQAHHSAGAFDLTKHLVYTGTVEKWIWANPHAWLYVRLEKKDHTQEVWGFEGGGTSMLVREGWNAADLKVGDIVKVTASPERTGQHLGTLSQVQLSSGRVLSAGGPPPEASSGPPSPPEPYN